MNDNASHSSRDFNGELYGVAFQNPIPVDTQKRIYMPVWTETNANEFIFDGWYHPQTVAVLEGSATIVPGPNVTRNVDGTDYTTPSFFEVFFDTPGRVVLQVEIASIGANSVTLRSTRDFFVEGASATNPSTPAPSNLSFYGVTSGGVLQGYANFADLWAGTNPTVLGTSSFDQSYSYFEANGSLFAVAPDGNLFESSSFENLWSGVVTDRGVVANFASSYVFSFLNKIYVVNSSNILIEYQNLADALANSNANNLGTSNFNYTQDNQFITDGSLVRVLTTSDEILAYTSVEAAWNGDFSGYDSELSRSTQNWTHGDTKITGYSNSNTGGN